jgi:hypothetical protein
MKIISLVKEVHMKTRYFQFVILILTLFVVKLCQAAGDGGQPGASLRRGVGVRALAMGNAYTSVSNDASSIYWNAAGLSQIGKFEFQGMYSFLSFDRQQLFVSVGGKISDAFALGAGWYKFGVSDIDGRDRTGNPTQKFEYSENSFMVSAAMKVGVLSIGLTGKYLHHSLADKSATGFGADVGVKIALINMFNVGFVLQDIGSHLNWNTSSNLKETIPLTIRGGVAFRPDFIPLLVSMEAVKTGSEDLTFRAGGEYRIVEFFGVRVGYDGENASFGGMIKVPLESFGLQLDYAATHDALDNTFVHHIALSILF